MRDLEHEDIQQLLSIPAASVPGQVGRRRFLQGALASAGALSFLPSVFDGMASAATPVGPDDGILIVIQMGGGNDGLNMVPPRGSSTYQSLRGSLAITNLFCRGTWVTRVSRDLGDGQEARRGLRVPPRGRPEGW